MSMVSMWDHVKFDTHGQNPSVQRLALHLPDHQLVYFRDLAEVQDQVQRGTIRKTQLLDFFRLNSIDAIGYGHRARSLLYQDIPMYFWWDPKKGWKGRRILNNAIGRMYFASPTDGERYFLRLLLLHVRGPTSFESLRTINGIQYKTFREAANAAGLLMSDSHYEDTIRKAKIWMTGHSLRLMFSVILILSPPSSPQRLYNMFEDDLSDDCLHKI